VERHAYVEHVPVPGRPGAVLVVIHADLTLPVLEALLDRPTQGGGAAQHGHGDVGGGIREGVLELAVRQAAQEEDVLQRLKAMQQDAYTIGRIESKDRRKKSVSISSTT